MKGEIASKLSQRFTYIKMPVTTGNHPLELYLARRLSQGLMSFL